ncbi:CPBP family intramembrane metalloprotease [Kineosporia sp. J2-2]|uniref:CPBP family intramembrane metalloprotease n=1 Tax=Kineosporia corallincola TaxID=2835133 RepID=A0ABS5TJG1_9ACTN|nr:CPBP family intramembrane glutamic endopeptidase [Kineosporia corallincola]MBT0771216.1 CPBP family intramembrane metalloprotease [Kineosporia corallincola]
MLAHLRKSVLTRMIALIVLFMLVDSVVAGGLSRMVDTTNPFQALLVLVLGGLAAWGTLRLYRYVINQLELREPDEIAPEGAGRAVRKGTYIGIALLTLVMLLIAMFGGYESLGWGSVWPMLSFAGLMVAVAVIEELVFRAILFRLLEQMTGTVGALVGSALIFGAMHLINPNATLWGAVSIAVQGGLMLGAIYAVTRNVWLPIGFHFGWNFAQAGLFGVAVSGSENRGSGLLTSVLDDGPTVVTGGDFGPEATLFALLSCLIVFLVVLRRVQLRSRTQARELAAA